MMDNLNQLHNRQRRYAPRSRVGCVPCRRRHKRCPGREPQCEACQRLNIECTWPPRRHFPAGDGAEPRAPRTTASPRFQTESSPPALGTPDVASAGFSPRLPLISSPNSLGYSTADELDERIIMAHYIHSFVPNISVANTPTNFMTSVYLPMAFYCDAVKDAVLACASAHLSQTAPSWTRQARLLELSSKHQMRSKQFLQNAVSASDSGHQHQHQRVLETVAISLMLIALDVLNGAYTSTWMEHLGHIREAIHQCGGKDAFQSISWEAKGLCQLFLYYDVMQSILLNVNVGEVEYGEEDDGWVEPGLALIGPTDISRPWTRGLPDDDPTVDAETPSSNPSEWFDPVDPVDPMLGLAMHIFRLIGRTRRLRVETDGLDICHTRGFRILEHEILAVQFNLPPSQSMASPQLSDAGTRLDLLTLAEINRLTALALLYDRSDSQRHQLPELARQVLALVDRIPAGSSVETGLTHPLFLAGAHLTSEEDTTRCANRMADIRQRLKFMNIRLAEEILQDIWRPRTSVLPDWRHIMQQRQWVVNLA